MYLELDGINIVTKLYFTIRIIRKKIEMRVNMRGRIVCKGFVESVVYYSKYTQQ